MKWMRTFSIVEIFFQCLKKLVERRTRNPKFCFRYQVSIEAQFLTAKIFLYLILSSKFLFDSNGREAEKNIFLLGQTDIKRANYFLSVGL